MALKLVHKIQFKKRAPRAISGIKKLAQKMMGTQDVRIDQKLNKYIWNKGIRNLPRRVRIRMERKRNEDEAAEQRMYTLVQHIECADFKGLQTQASQEE